MSENLTPAQRFKEISEQKEMSRPFSLIFVKDENGNKKVIAFTVLENGNLNVMTKQIGTGEDHCIEEHHIMIELTDPEEVSKTIEWLTSVFKIKVV